MISKLWLQNGLKMRKLGIENVANKTMSVWLMKRCQFGLISVNLAWKIEQI